MDFSGPALTDISSGAETASRFGTSAAPPVRHADVAIIGGGLAGSILALVLGRQGVSAAVIDPQGVYPDDFRCEKLTSGQLALLEELGVSDGFLPVAQPHAAASPFADRGFRYDHLVNAMRALWPDQVQFIQDRAKAVISGDEAQRVELTGGGHVGARLVVLATGPSGKLRTSLGVEREVLRERHSVCAGFSIAPQPGSSFSFPHLLHCGERAGDGVGFVSIFPWADAMRVNLFTFHDPRSDVVRHLREDPLAALFGLMPGLRKTLAGAVVTSPIEIRSTDLFRTGPPQRPGLVLIGDARASSCPATGLGVTRILTDIRQLAHVHLPSWLQSPSMHAGKIAQFESDPVRLRLDAAALRQAEAGRSVALETSLVWRLRRRLGALRRWARQAPALFTVRYSTSRSLSRRIWSPMALSRSRSAKWIQLSDCKVSRTRLIGVAQKT